MLMSIAKTLRQIFAVFAAAALFFTFSCPAHAQADLADVRFGLTVGLNLATLSGSYVDEPSGSGASLLQAEVLPRRGIMLGGYAVIPIAPSFFLQPELLYLQKGSDIEISLLGASGGGTDRAGYLELPVLVRFELPIEQEDLEIPFQPYMVGGPTVGLKLHAGSGVRGDASVVEDFDDVTKTFDFGLTAGVGAGYDLSAGTVSAEVRYAQGLTDIITLSDKEARTRGIMITLGIVF